MPPAAAVPPVLPQGAAVAALAAGTVPDDSAAAKAMAAAMATMNGGNLDAIVPQYKKGGGTAPAPKKDKDAIPTIAVTARVLEEKKPQEKAPEPVYASQEERVQAFMKLLEDVSGWEDWRECGSVAEEWAGSWDCCRVGLVAWCCDVCAGWVVSPSPRLTVVVCAVGAEESAVNGDVGGGHATHHQRPALQGVVAHPKEAGLPRLQREAGVGGARGA